MAAAEDGSRALYNSVGESGETPCVFYCGECRQIFGDSLSTIRLNEDLHSVSLQMVTDAVVLTKECETSVSGSDKGSSYIIMKCKSCHNYIGRYYTSTPRSLDSIREMYTLDLDVVERQYMLKAERYAMVVLSLSECINIVQHLEQKLVIGFKVNGFCLKEINKNGIQFGSCGLHQPFVLITNLQLEVKSPHNAKTRHGGENKSYHLGSCVSNSNEHVVKDPLGELKEVIFKTQSVVLALNERVVKLESFLEEIEREDNTQREINGKRKKKSKFN